MAATPISSSTALEGQRRRRTWRSRANMTALVMLAPAILALLAIGIYPLIYAVRTSFQLFQLTKPYLGTPWVGFDNYRTVLQDGLFWGALWRTLQFFLLTVPIQVVLGVGIALLLNNTRWRLLGAVARVLLVLPIAMTPTVVGLLGRLIYNRDFGVINWALGQIGLGPVNWLGSPFPSMASIAITDTWQWTPFVALVALAGLTSVPEDIVEASRLDTNRLWEIFRHIQLPYLLPGLTAVLIIRTADILKLFDMVFVLTRGGPGVSTELISLYVQRVGFRVFDVGVASAQAVLLLILCIVLAQSYIRIFYREIEEA
ncbi:MAG TPA: sugar ABC transporter permease [Thermomicrobiales bacterium]|nr:sugar ABC transporter permease [Thermomicrobiales bacterium]